MNDKEALKKRLGELQRSSGMTQAQCGEKAGLGQDSRLAWANALRAGRSISTRKLDRMARVFGLRVVLKVRKVQNDT